MLLSSSTASPNFKAERVLVAGDTFVARYADSNSSHSSLTRLEAGCY